MLSTALGYWHTVRDRTFKVEIRALASPRRMGSPEAKNRAALLDAAEHIMLEEGYPAASSRRVAEKAGIKHQLVHYYFHGMDELFTAAFRRSAERGLRVQAEALKSPQPLWALWRWHTDTVNAPLWTEYIAMANHRKGLRAEIAYYSKRFREEQRWIVDRALKAYGVDQDELPAAAAIVLLTSISRVLVMEEALEVSDGHAETVAIVERYLRQLEGEPIID
jgi:AcrR family transcriptional regulator